MTNQSKSFILPEPGNSITQSDINRAVLRITVGLKDQFPANSGRVSIRVRNIEKSVVYTVKTGRSNTLSVGKDLMETLALREGSSVLFTKVNGTYMIEKQ